jgi:hypothetical protein
MWLPSDLEVIDSKVFSCTPVHLGKKGDGLATMVTQSGSWSIRTETSEIKGKRVTYPFFMSAKDSKGASHGLFVATVTFKIDLKPGEVVHSEGYRIETKRAIKSGESIPTIYFFTPIVSIESAPGDQHPAIVISKEAAQPADLTSAEEVWRLFQKRVVRE